MRTPPQRSWSLLLLFLAAAPAAPLRAEDTPDPDAAAAATVAESIQVTATRIPEDVLDVPAAVTVVTGAEDCLAMCERLIGLANARGGPDNITVLVARVQGDGLGPAERSGAPARKLFANGGAGGGAAS